MLLVELLSTSSSSDKRCVSSCSPSSYQPIDPPRPPQEKVKERELDALESEKRREKDASRSSHRDRDRHDRDPKHRDGESGRSSARRGGERERDRESRERSLGGEESKVKRGASDEVEGAPKAKVVKREEVVVLKEEDRDVEMEDVEAKKVRPAVDFRRLVLTRFALVSAQGSGEVEEGEIE